MLLSLMKSVKEFRLTAQQLHIYTYWYIPVIRELACIVDFRDDFTLLAKSVLPTITPTEAKSAVKLLVSLKMLRKMENGRYEQSDRAIEAKSELNAMAVMNFTKAMTEKAINALLTLPKDERNFSTITCGMSPACYELILAEIGAFRDRIVGIINNDTRTRTDRVYQFNFQLFPVSRDQGERSYDPFDYLPLL